MTQSVPARPRNADRSDILHHGWFEYGSAGAAQWPVDSRQGTHDGVEATHGVGLETVEQPFEVNVVSVVLCGHLALTSDFDVNRQTSKVLVSR